MSATGSASSVEASLCPSCGRYFVPSRRLCPVCRSVLQKTMVEGKGRILSWTIVYATPEGIPSPRTVALVGLECGASVLCLVPDIRVLEIGAGTGIASVEGIFHLK